MTQSDPEELREWVSVQVTEFSRRRPYYEAYADLLKRLLERISDEIAPQSIVSVRTKSTERFAQKILRKKEEFPDPAHQFTDLCGARIIAKTRASVKQLEAIIEKRFCVDTENSVDTIQRLNPSEFGYRSTHYIVSLLPDRDYGEEIPKECYGLKAEIQLRTFAEHAWADFTHELSYKGAFTLPAPWKRELAGSWKGIDDDRSRYLYRRAMEIDPADPYPLGNFVEFEVARDRSRLDLLRPLLRGAITRCRDHIEAGINLPWVFYDLGKFQLLLEEPHESLNAYAKAILASTAQSMIATSLASLERLAPAADGLPGYAWVRRLLLIGLAARSQSGASEDQVAELASPGAAVIGSPVVIVAGGTAPWVENEMRNYESAFLEAFADFEGTIISGGTTHGVSGLVGDLAFQRPGSVHTIGYLPRVLSENATPDTDPQRYRELRYTDGEQFTPLEPLQNWIDLIASGISPSEVRVLGINGGVISAAEYRIALSLGATVGLLAESGREAGKLLADESWMMAPGLIRLPRDAQTIAAFVTRVHCDWPDSTIDKIASEIHERYLAKRASSLPLRDRAVTEWNALSDELQNSNRAQTRHIPAKLARAGCAAVKISGAKARSFSFSDEDIETLAEMEHGRWNVYMLLRGWAWGETRDYEKKTTPDLVRWADLPERVRNLDREFVRTIPQVLSSVGLEIRKQ